MSQYSVNKLWLNYKHKDVALVYSSSAYKTEPKSIHWYSIIVMFSDSGYFGPFGLERGSYFE